MDGIREGMRVTVADPPDGHCAREIVWGTGEVVRVAGVPGGRVEVRFDGGSGGYFDPSLLRPAPADSRRSVFVLMSHAGRVVGVWDAPPAVAQQAAAYSAYLGKTVDALTVATNCWLEERDLAVGEGT